MKELDKKTQEKIIRLITALLPDVKIYLFGSRARGTNSERSDIDLALDAGHKLDRFLVYEIKTVLEGTRIPNKIDVLDFHSVSDEMKSVILRDRKIWKN